MFLLMKVLMFLNQSLYFSAAPLSLGPVALNRHQSLIPTFHYTKKIVDLLRKGSNQKLTNLHCISLYISRPLKNFSSTSPSQTTANTACGATNEH